MRSYWFGDVENGVCTPAPQETDALLQRVSSLKVALEEYVPADWRCARKARIVCTREEYLTRLHALCMELSARRANELLGAADRELIALVRLHDTLLVSMENVREQLSTALEISCADASNAVPLDALDDELAHLEDVRSSLMQAIARRAEEIAPNCSALAGGMIAGRLIARAGGLERLAMMPASSIQVLGAEKALFAHLRGECPPPKHGILYQHRKVHTAPRSCRGRVARAFAASIAIGARIDLYRGAIDENFVSRSRRRIQQKMRTG